jgi:SAM-dependent methyltransferase
VSASIPNHYGGYYRDAAADVYATVRREIYGDDLGQNSWLTREQLDSLVGRLGLGDEQLLVDVGSGLGGPAIYVARTVGCHVVGVDVSAEAVTAATALAEREGLSARATFRVADGGSPLPFDDGSVDALLCIDAVNHFPGRDAVLADWARLLRPAGRLAFTDALVVTGPVSSEEVAARASIGFQIMTPVGANERLLEQCGLRLLAAEDLTDSLAQIAARRRDVRAAHAEALRPLEGDRAFDGRQHFFDLVARLAEERRLSRFAYLAERA